MISLLAPNVDVDWVCHVMMGGAEHELSKLHASIFFVRIGTDSDWKKVERMTRAGGVDGWLVYGPVNDEVVDRLNSSKLPFIILGDHRCTQPVHSVNSDNEAAGRLAVQHLASLGHRRIGLLDGEMQFVYQEQTSAGFRAAVRELRLDDEERLITHDASLLSKPTGERVIEWLRTTSPTALFVPDCDWAIAVSRILRESQVHVPNEISVVTCDPVAVVAKSHGFTHIQLPLSEVGHQGALLLHRLASERDAGPGEVKIPPVLVEGWTARPPRNRP